MSIPTNRNPRELQRRQATIIRFHRVGPGGKLVTLKLDVRTLGFDNVHDLMTTAGWSVIMQTAADRLTDKLHKQ